MTAFVRLSSLLVKPSMFPTSRVGCHDEPVLSMLIDVFVFAIEIFMPVLDVHLRPDLLGLSLLSECFNRVVLRCSQIPCLTGVRKRIMLPDWFAQP